MGRFLKNFLINRWNEQVFHLPFVIIAVETLNCGIEAKQATYNETIYYAISIIIETQLVIEIP